MSSEKQPLALPVTTAASAPAKGLRSKWSWIAPTLISAWLLSRALPLDFATSATIDFAALEKHGASCPVQPKPLPPKMALKLEDGYRAHSAKLLSEAVQIPTESFDDNGLPTEDPRWAPFFDFQKWLVKTFPLVHEKAKVEYVNTLGIVVTLQGSDPSLKPMILMSHYDVVPAPASTADRWTHGTFSGFIDDEYVWGRGAADDKTLLVAQYEAMTELLKQGFEAKRTIILSHGFDEEEVGKRQGAGHIAPFLEERYGKDGVLLVIDEGTGVTDDVWGAAFATPSSREKGYADVKITVGTPGGHSSVPPEHTGIGLTSLIIQAIEANPFTPTLTTESPLLGYITCAAKYSPKFPSSYAKLLKNPKKWGKLAAEWASQDRATRAILSTTQAVDIFNAGVKVNALPESSEMYMNFRIDFASSVAETQKHLTQTIAKVADKYDLTMSAFDGKNASSLGARYVKAELFGLPLEPSPDTPEEGALWDMFAGTIRSAIPAPDGSARIVSPYSSTGNTDTKVYWNLSRNIYRFMSANSNSGGGVHTVDEKTSIDGHLDIVKWVHAIIQNVNDYTGPQ